MCCILRVLKLRTLINTSHLRGFWDGRLWEAKSFVFYVSGKLWRVKCVVFYVCWKVLGGKINYILRVWKALEGSGRLNVWYFTCLEA